MEPVPYLDEAALARLPLFPLPSTVFFPGTELPLHVFEPRYRDMVRHCLAGDRAMAVVLLEAGFEKDYDGRPPIHPVAGAGVVVQAEELADGRWNIVLWGTDRVRILEEHPPNETFRIARCARLKERHDGACLEAAERCLRGLALRLADAVPDVKEPITRLLGEVDGGAALADQLACRLVPDPLARQAILEEVDVTRRLERVTREVAEVCLRVDPACRRGSGPVN
jgi:uncharacterized protein